MPLDQVTAYIDPAKCINCGTCREACPADAIQENQRIICHSCPMCTEKPGLSPQRVDELATECSCTTACPLGLSPQGYIGLAREGMDKEAFQLIWSKNPLPSVCGSVCHHPCEDSCKRGILVDHPLKIRGIKKYLSVTQEADIPKYKRLYDEDIAVIGAGPAGLTAGHYLASMGYGVTIFERLQNAELNIPGWRLAGVIPAVKFMRQINHEMEVQRHLGQIFNYKGGDAVIIGGGSVAMDAARTALRSGAASVTVVSLESGEDFPANPWEKEEALEEGITIIKGYSPVEYQSNVYPTLKGVKFAKVVDFKKDETGKISFATDADDTMELKADWVVEAVGQKADSLWQEYQDEKDIFFAGDAAGGKCSVIDAMASGRDAARQIDMSLRGRVVKESVIEHTLNTAPVMEKIFPYNRRKNIRPEIPVLKPAERTSNFQETEGVMTPEQVREETLSCLQCRYEAVDPEKCIACGMCQKLCPKGDVITMVAKGGSTL